MKLVYGDTYWDVSVNWSRPMIYDNLIYNGSQHDDFAHLYMITGRYRGNKNKVFYIGKTYRQTVSHRLTQEDHKERYDELKHKYPRHKLYVSHGIVSIVGGKRTSTRIDEIESILIYSMPKEHSINKKNAFKHKVTGQYWIENKGYKSNLLKHIGLGVVTK